MRGRTWAVVGIIVAGVALQACGSGGGASSPTAPAAPAPVATPAAVTAPSPTPTATPAPTPSAAPTPNLRPVAKVNIKIEYIDCPATGELNQHGPFNWTSVGCRIHMDMTPRDKYNKPTEGAKGHPDWILNDPSLVYFRPDTYTPVLRAERAGKLIIQGELDGIKSNQVEIHLY